MDKPPLEAAMEELGLQEVQTYVYRHQNTFSLYIVNKSIMDLSVLVERAGGFRGKTFTI